MTTGAKVAIGCVVAVVLAVGAVIAVVVGGAWWANGKIEQVAGVILELQAFDFIACLQTLN